MDRSLKLPAAPRGGISASLRQAAGKFCLPAVLRSPCKELCLIFDSLANPVASQGECARYCSSKYGRQFKAIEKKPATTAALEKYLGSGLIKGVGPKTAKKIVNHFGEKTLDIFEEEIEQLTEVRGIAQKKLDTIRDA